MVKAIEKVELRSLFDPTKSIEVEAVVDTGATMLVLPQNLVTELGLRKIDEVTVKYANNQKQQKSVYAGLLVEIKGRAGNFSVLAEEEGTEPLIGQVVLEQLDLVIEPRTRTLAPNPRSPDLPMVEILVATAAPKTLKAMIADAGWSEEERRRLGLTKQRPAVAMTAGRRRGKQ